MCWRWVWTPGDLKTARWNVCKSILWNRIMEINGRLIQVMRAWGKWKPFGWNYEQNYVINTETELKHGDVCRVEMMMRLNWSSWSVTCDDQVKWCDLFTTIIRWSSTVLVSLLQVVVNVVSLLCQLNYVSTINTRDLSQTNHHRWQVSPSKPKSNQLVFIICKLLNFS